MSASWEAPRKRITGRITGRIVQWKGKFGWIQPTAPINHPDAHKRGGKVYIAQEDVEAEIEVKGVVSFNTYVDSTGLGASNCRPATEGQMQQASFSAAHKGKGEGKGGAGIGARMGGKAATKGAAKGGSASLGAGAKAAPRPGGQIHGTVLKTILKRTPGGPAPPTGAPPKGARKGAASKAAQGEAGAERSGPPPPPDTTMRERLLPDRIVGKIIRWRGHTGWIKPSEPIDHPDAATFKKSAFLHEVDVLDGSEMAQGAQVSFHLYRDSHGIGAEEVMLTDEQPDPAEIQEEAAEKPSGRGAKKAKGKGKGAGGLTMVQKTRLKRKGKGGKKGEDGEPREKLPCGPDLARERITDMPISGEVIMWRKNFGWVRPSEAIEHEKAQVHGGRIYLHEKDVIPEGSLEVGTKVEFQVYVDENSLGAEECIVTG